MSSIRKESTSISLSDSERPTPASCCATSSSSYAAACSYPPSAPHRPAYLAARWLNLFFTVVLTALSVVALKSLNRPNWMSPIMSPAISAWWPNGFNIFLVHRCNRRTHPLTRLFYDGALGVGFAIANGFLISFMIPDLTGDGPTASGTTKGVAGLVLFGMFSVM
jgi:hypothetical protein